MGIGGMLMWTVVAKEIYKKYNKKVVFFMKNKNVFKKSADPAHGEQGCRRAGEGDLSDTNPAGFSKL